MFLHLAADSFPHECAESPSCDASDGPTERKPDRRTQLAQAALNLVQRRLPARVGEAELVRELGVGIRLIQISFRAQFGESIKSATTRMLLEGARAELLHHPYRHGELSRVARTWGFNHPGRFAVAYRRRFGETPVQTWRKNAPPASAEIPVTNPVGTSSGTLPSRK